MSNPDPVVLLFAGLRRALLGSRRGKAALADVPLFLVVGPRGAGKTAWLTHCGLSFGYQSPRGFDRLTARATHDAAFLELDLNDDPRAGIRERDNVVAELVKATAVRPLAGIIVCIPVADVGGDAIPVALRALIDAVVTRCGAHVPIHVVVTQIDRIAGYGEFLQAAARAPAPLGVQLPAGPIDPKRWHTPIAWMFDAVFEACVGLMSGSPRSTPLRFGLGARTLAQPLVDLLARLETPSRGGPALWVRSVLCISTQAATAGETLPPPEWIRQLGLGPVGAAGSPPPSATITPFASLATEAILADADIAAFTASRRAASTLRWTLPVGLVLAAGLAGVAVVLALPSDPPPAVIEPEAPAPIEPEAPKRKPAPVEAQGDACADVRGFEGDWAFRTHVDGSPTGSSIGIVGHYLMTLSIAEDCRVTAQMTKLGWTESGRFNAHDPVHESTVALRILEAAPAADVLRWAGVGKAVFDRDSDQKHFEMFMSFGVRVDGDLVGVFEYQDAQSPAPKLFWGRVTGTRSAATAAWNPAKTSCAADAFVARTVSSKDAEGAFRAAVARCNLEAP